MHCAAGNIDLFVAAAGDACTQRAELQTWCSEIHVACSLCKAILMHAHFLEFHQLQLIAMQSHLHYMLQPSNVCHPRCLVQSSACFSLNSMQCS